MSGFLGYHPEGVLALRRALAAALTEGRSFRCDDTLALDPVGRCHRALGVLAPWEARLVTILSCGFDSPYRRVAPTIELPIDYLRPVDRGWTVVTDPLTASPPPVDLLGRVPELLALLAALEPGVIGDPADVRRLDTLLAAVMADADARRLLFELMGPDGFASIVHGLARLTFSVDGGDELTQGAVTVLARLAAGAGAAVREGVIDEAEAFEALADRDDYLAALVLRHARLPTDVATRWAMTLTERMAVSNPASMARFVPPGDRAMPELVLQALTDDPEAGRRVLMALDDLDLLLGPHIDSSARTQFLLATSDPARFPIGESVPLVVKVLGYLDDHRSVASSTFQSLDLHAGLGAYVGPFLLELVPPTGQHLPIWGDRRPAEVLSWIAESPVAASSLIDWIDRHQRATVAHAASADTIQGFARLLDGPGDQLGFGLGAVEDGLLEGARHDAASYQQATGLFAFTLELLIERGLDSAAPGAGAVAELPLGWMIDRGLDLAEDRGVLRKPLPVQDAAIGVERIGGQVEAQLMHTAAVEVHRSEVARGRVPTSAPPPPAPRPGADAAAYMRELNRWGRTQADEPMSVAAAGAVRDAVDAGRARGRGEDPGVPCVTRGADGGLDVALDRGLERCVAG